MGGYSHDYKVSKFTLFEPLPDCRLGLFNTLTRAVGVLPVSAWDDLQAGADTSQDVVSDLTAQGFIVARDLDEDLILSHWRNSQAYDVSDLLYIISPTHSCNMNCGYCVHGRKKEARHMSMETGRAVLDFIIEDIDKKRPRGVVVDFGGAEALLNRPVLSFLCEGLSRFGRSRALGIKFGLITNGLALDRGLIEELSPLGLGKVRVTLSGPARTHDRHRRSRDNGATYHRIINNLSAIAGLVPLGIVGQYDSARGEHLLYPELLDDLVRAGLREHIQEISFGPIVPTGNGPGSRTFDDRRIGCLHDEDPGRYIWLQDQIRARGFSSPLGPPSNRCLANYRNTRVIDIDGQITVCPSMMDFPELDFGHVATGIDFRKESRLLARRLPDRCQSDCLVAPLCDGGCRYQGWVRTGNFDAVNCLKESFEILARAYLRQTVKHI